MTDFSQAEISLTEELELLYKWKGKAENMDRQKTNELVILRDSFKTLARGYMNLIEGGDPDDKIFRLLEKYGFIDENQEFVYENEDELDEDLGNDGG